MKQNYNIEPKKQNDNDVIAQNSNLKVVKSNKPEGIKTSFRHNNELVEQNDHVIYTFETDQLISIFRKEYNQLLLSTGQISSLRDAKAFKGKEASALRKLVKLLGVRLNERKKDLAIVSYGDISIKKPLPYLAEVFETSISTTKRYLKKLEDFNLIKVVQEGRQKRIYFHSFYIYFNKIHQNIHQINIEMNFNENIEKMINNRSFWTTYNIIQEINTSLVSNVDKLNTNLSTVTDSQFIQGATKSNLTDKSTENYISPGTGAEKADAEIKRNNYIMKWAEYFLHWMIINLYKPQNIELTDSQKEVVIDFFFDYSANKELWELQKWEFGKQGTIIKALNRWKNWVSKKHDRFTPIPQYFFNEANKISFHAAINWTEKAKIRNQKHRFKHKNNIIKLANRAKMVLNGELNAEFSNKTYQFRKVNRELTMPERIFVYNKIIEAAERYCAKHNIEYMLETFSNHLKTA